MKTSISLLERVQADADDDDWKQLADLYSPLIRAWLSRHGMAPSDADDVVQEVLTVVMKKLSDFRRQRTGSFRSWLRNITVLCARDHFRKRQRAPQATGKTTFHQVLEQMENPESGLSRMWNEEHDRHVFRTIVEKVRPEFAEATWQAFRRTAIDGAAAKDVAAELELTQNAVFIARSRVLARLKAEAKGLLDDV